MARAAWAALINRGPDFLPLQEYTIVVVSDEKYRDEEVYWREKEIRNDERMEFAWEAYHESGKGNSKTDSKKYKGSRSPKPQEFLDLKNIGMDYCKSYFPFFSQEGFEADDWAGAIYRISRDTAGVCRDREILLATLDRDWSMLVDDEHKVRFANTRIPREKEHIQNRLAKEEDVLYHTEYRTGESISHPSQLAETKHIHGDLGDNLPPGSPVEYFDLCKPHWKHNIEGLGSKYNDLLRAVNSEQANTRREHFLKSVEMFRKSGIPLPIRDTYYEKNEKYHCA